MSRIAYFISDHGLGHATRSVAIIRELLKCDLEVSLNIHTLKPLAFVKKSLAGIDEPERITFHEQLNDIGFAEKEETGEIDYPHTAKEIHPWIQGWGNNYHFDEYSYLKKKEVDLIVSDIAPQPFLLAKKLNLPSIAISNFTWFDIYQDSSFESNDLEAIWRAYREASLGLMLPFNLENLVFPTIIETSLVSRNPTRTRNQMRNLLDVDTSAQIIYAGTGFSMKNPFLQEWVKEDDFIYIIGSQTDIEGENVHVLPKNDTESQDYISCCDIALIKFGYSSVSEAIRSCVPIIGVDFAQTEETKFMAQKVQDLGIGVEINSEEYFQGKWKELIPEALELRNNYSNLPERYTKKGESEVAGIILSLLEELC